MADAEAARRSGSAASAGSPGLVDGGAAPCAGGPHRQRDSLHAGHAPPRPWGTSVSAGPRRARWKFRYGWVLRWGGAPVLWRQPWPVAADVARERDRGDVTQVRSSQHAGNDPAPGACTHRSDDRSRSTVGLAARVVSSAARIVDHGHGDPRSTSRVAEVRRTTENPSRLTEEEGAGQRASGGVLERRA